MKETNIEVGRTNFGFFNINLCRDQVTVRDPYCCDPLEVSGANPIMKKLSLGNRVKLTTNFLRSGLILGYHMLSN